MNILLANLLLLSLAMSLGARMPEPASLLRLVADSDGPRSTKTEGKNESNSELTIDALTHQCKLRYEQGEYVEADGLAREALSIAEQTLGPLHAKVGLIVSNLAAVQRARRRFLDAERSYLRALSVFEHDGNPDNRQLATTLANFALLRTDQGRYAAAEKLTKQAIEVWERASAPPDLLLASALTNLGTVYLLIGRKSEADTAYTRALRIVASVPSNSNDLAAVLYNIGGFRAVQKSYDEAERYLERAVGVWTERLGPSHPYVATASLGLGYVYTKRGRYDEAAEVLKRALGTREAIFGPASRNVAEVLLLQAFLLRRTRHGKEARTLESKARQILSVHPEAGYTEQLIDISTLLWRNR